MKKLAILALLFASTAINAAPFVQGSGTIQTTDTCNMQEGANPVVSVPATAGTPNVCKWDASGFAAGSHTVNLWVSNVWGAGPTIPFTFTKGVPPALSSGSIVAN